MKTFDGYSKEKFSDTSVLLAGGGSKELSNFIGTLNWDSTNRKLQYKKIGDTNWRDLVTFGSNATNSTAYLPLSGGTMTGLLTTTSGGSHKGIKVGNTYINAINGDLIFQNNTAIRFGGDSWDYNVWAGLKYVHSSKIIYLGLADGSAFTANSAQSNGKLYLPGIANIYTGNGSNLVWHAGNDGSGSGLDADLLDGYHANSFSLTNHTHTFASLTSKPTTLSGYGITDGLYSTQVSAAQDNVTWAKGIAKTHRRAFYYNTSGTEYSYLFGLSPSNTSSGDVNYGAVLKMGYTDSYLRILRVQNGSWKTTDWEKISAGYADSAAKWTTSRTLTIGNTGKLVDGSGNVSWSLTEIGASAAAHTHSVKINGSTKTIAASGGAAVDLGSYLPLSGGNINGTLSLYPTGLDNTAFKNTLLIKQQNSTETSGDNWGDTYPTFGIGFRRFWTSNGNPYGETTCAGIYATISSSWRGGLVFRTKNNTTSGGTHDVSALRLAPSGAAYFANTVNATTFVGSLSGNASSATKLESSAGNTALPIYFSDGKPVACTPSSLFSNLSNDGNNLSITIAGQNRTLTVGYASNSNIATYLNVQYCRDDSSPSNKGLWNTIKNGTTNTIADRVRFYTIYGTTTALGAPVNGNGELLEICSWNANHYQPQLWFGSGKDSRLYYRNKFYNDDSWGAWRTVAWTSDIPTSLKNPYALTISLNGTNQGAYDGSAAKNINITPSSIGAASSSHTHSYANIGFVTFTPANGELTPAQVLALTGGWSIKKGSWNYAGNGYIVAGSFGNIDLAGTSVLTFGDSNAYTQLYITAPAQSGHSGKTNEIFFYNDHGSSYLPGWTRIVTNHNYTDYVNATNFPGLNKTGTVTSVTVTGSNGLSGTGTITTSGTITLSNSGVRSTIINGNYLRVNTNGTNADLTIPYATNADKLDGYHETTFFRYRGDYGKSYTAASTEYKLGPGTYTTDEPGYSGTLLAFNSTGSTSGLQFWTHYQQGNLYYRTSIDSNRWGKTDGAWTRILDSDNYTTYTVTKNGTGASGTWGISITGNADTSNRTKFLETFKQDSTTDTYGTSYPIWAQWSDTTNVRLKCTDYTVWVDKSDYSTSSSNASSATKLQTARTIWGQSFNGTANISGTLSGVTNIQFNADNTYDIGSNSAASRYIYTYWLGAKSGQKLELGANNSSYGQGLCIDTNLNVGIGTSSPSQKLHVDGNAIATNFGVNASGGGNGISLYSGSSNVAIYGIAFNQTSNWGTHGYVTSDWATYFTMNNQNNRGWIFKRNGSDNVFSIDTSGQVYANGRINGNYYTSRVATGTQPYACTSTTLNTNLNSDLLDGYHASSFESYHKVTIDTTGLNSNTWYPVTMAIENAIQTRIRIEGNTSTTGTWNTRSDKLMSVELDYTTQGSSWGWVSPFRTIFLFNLGAGASGSNCIAGIGQLENSGTEYVYVRGGAKYNFYVSRFITPTLRTSTYTINSQSISPTTTSPTVIHRNNALISDIPTVTNYYWANVKISTSSNTATNPTFGNTTTNKLTISNTEAIGHLVFSRGNYNYITAPTGGSISFCVNGNAAGSSANCEMIISDGNIFPGTTNVTSLGKSSNRWNTVYSALGDFTSYIKTGSYITFGDNGYYLTSDIRNSWRTSIYGNNASGSRLRTVRTEITIDNFSEIYGSSLAWATGDTQGYLSVSYGSGKAWIGGGNKDKLNWSTYLVTGNNIGSQSVNQANQLKYTGLGTSVFTVAQTNEDFCGRSGWATYLIGNHGNGSTYYHQIIAMPFDKMPQYQKLENGTQGSWYTFAMMGYANSGDLYAAHFYENSDIRYKHNIKNRIIEITNLASLPIFDYTWEDSIEINTGTSAQAVQAILPYIVSGTDKLTLDYGVLGTVAGITACKELVKHEDELTKLKQRVLELEEQINQLKNK